MKAHSLKRDSENHGHFQRKLDRGEVSWISMTVMRFSGFGDQSSYWSGIYHQAQNIMKLRSAKEISENFLEYRSKNTMLINYIDIRNAYRYAV